MSENMDNSHQHKERRKERRKLWGRAKGRPLSPYQAKLVEENLPKLNVSLGPDLLPNLPSNKGVILEIGFGGAEHLLFRAAENKDKVYIGVEPFLNGVAKAVTAIAEASLTNVLLHHGDVREVFEHLPDACLEEIYILYPDPWPKKRHFKRRLIQEEIIEDMHRTLKPGGKLYFASDILSYVNWALARILRHGGFNWPAETAKDWQKPYKNWPSTRYEAKALREGRTPHYFTFVKEK